jgi:hypothetical protein
MIWDFLRPILDGFVNNPGQLGLGIALVASVLYYRKMMSAASLLSTLAGKLVFSAAVVGLLLLSGIIPTLNVDVAMGYAMAVVEMVLQFLRDAGVSIPSV